MTAPIKFARCHPDKKNFSNGRCKDCWDWIKNPEAPCPHFTRKLDSKGRCSSCMSRYYELRRKRGIGDRFGSFRITDSRLKLDLTNISSREELNNLMRLKRRARYYGISLEEYFKLVEAQNNLCAICNKVDTRGLSIDHDHSCCTIQKRSCGRCIRQLVCHGCNMRLGQIESDLVIKSLDYLYDHKSSTLLKIKEWIDGKKWD